ncbi:MAG: OstA-like protein [Bacteroidales bacterium]|nr:OstA-like protein [Bacteroidales bacterium]
MRKSLRNILIVAAVCVLPLTFYARTAPVPAPEPQSGDQDSLVRLISADSLQLLEVNGKSCRRVVGRPARFLHNNTYLLCDTAIWNVDDQLINAMGRVKIIQDRTELRSDKLNYYVDRDLAEFRGSVVILTDKDNNTLKTRFLDYNTKDSVAVFRNGASMRDKDGQIIESMSGSYDSKIKTFTFSEDVNMYTDSVFVKTTWLKYESDLSLATFGYNTHAWKDGDMLSSNAGTYDRSRENFFFNRDVHVMTDTQEGWCDSLYFNRTTMDVTMLGNAQVSDTTRSVHALAGRMDYVDSLAELTLTRQPAVVAEVDDENGRDSVWVGAEQLRYWTVPKCDLDSMELVLSAERLKSIAVDPVSELRRQAAEAAAKAAEEAAANDPNNAANAAKRKAEYDKQTEAKGTSRAKVEKPARISFSKPSAADTVAVAADTVAVREAADSSDFENLPVEAGEAADSSDVEDVSIVEAADAADTVVADVEDMPVRAAEIGGEAEDIPEFTELKMATDSLAVATDSLAVAADSLAAPKDTTKIGFMSAMGKVKIYRRTMQVTCDSLRYCDLDSLARLYREPKIWNEENHQYISDSVYVVIRNNAMEKANLMSNAFIHVQEDSIHYDQIRSAEMVAYFDKEGQLSRFDALGGALALFYIEENDALATVNKKDAKMLSAVFKDGTIQRIYYFQEVKSDAYPVVQMTKEDQTIKGFAWTPQDRPKSRYDITSLGFRNSQRKRYEAVPQPRFYQTDIYFPGYIADVHRQLQVRDSLKAVRARQRELERLQAEENAAREAVDSLAKADSLAIADSLGLVDSLGLAGSPAKNDSLAIADSLATVDVPADSLANAADSLAAAQPDEREMRRQQKLAEKAEAKRLRDEAREARWAEQDAKDALRQARKDAKKAEALRRKKARALRAAEQEKSREAVLLQKYLLKMEKAKARKEAKALKSETPAS